MVSKCVCVWGVVCLFGSLFSVSSYASVQARRCSNVPRGSSDVCWWTTVGEPDLPRVDDDKFAYVYVDNIGVLATFSKKASELMGKLTTTFGDAGLFTHVVSICESQGASPGTVLYCERRRSSFAQRRFWRLRQGSDAILSAKTVTGSTLDVVIGHATFCSLLARPSVTFFTRCFSTSNVSGLVVVFFGTRCVTISRLFRDFLILIVAEWLPMVLASDASEWGYGVTSMEARRSEIAKVGRIPERSRFRRNGDLGARAAVFSAAGDVERWAHALGVDHQSLRGALPEGNGMWELDDRFPEVPGRWRAKSLLDGLAG